MAGTNVLLDTNIVSALLSGDASLVERIDLSTGVFIPVIVIGELWYGAQYSSNVERNVSSIHDVASRYEVLAIDEETAEVYGSIKAHLRKKGRPIPENDVWIAAIAHQYNLTLVTRDKHFLEIEQITVLNW